MLLVSFQKSCRPFLAFWAAWIEHLSLRGKQATGLNSLTLPRWSMSNFPFLLFYASLPPFPGAIQGPKPNLSGLKSSFSDPKSRSSLSSTNLAHQRSEPNHASNQPCPTRLKISQLMALLLFPCISLITISWSQVLGRLYHLSPGRPWRFWLHWPQISNIAVINIVRCNKMNISLYWND